MGEQVTKAQIYAEVLRHENELIKASYLTNLLSISKQLVYYHLTQLIAQGVLEKVGTKYCLIDKDKLINLMVDATEGHNTLKRGEAAKFYPENYLNGLQDFVDYALTCRAMDLPDSIGMKTFLAEEIQNAIDTLKKERHYLLNKQTSRGTARKQINKKGDSEKWYARLVEDFERVGFKFNTIHKNRLDDLIDKMQEED